MCMSESKAKSESEAKLPDTHDAPTEGAHFLRKKKCSKIYAHTG